MMCGITTNRPVRCVVLLQIVLYVRNGAFFIRNPEPIREERQSGLVREQQPVQHRHYKRTMMLIFYSRSSVACNAFYLYAGFMLTLLLLSADAIDFLNWNMVDGVGGPFEALFYPSNNVDYEYISDSGSGFPEVPYTQNEDFLSGLQGLQDIIAMASRERKRLRPYGSRWTYNNLVYTDEYMIDTYGLNYAKIGIQSDNFVTIPYQGEQRDYLVFVQSGVVVKSLYRTLFAEGLTLVTNAQADGQTMAGCINTATHNSANAVGAMQDMVLGIHLLTANRHVFIQKESNPVVTMDYLSEIGADELIENDEDLFNAVLVSGGTFGIVHGYLIETERLFKLRVQAKNFPYSVCSKAVYSLDVSSLGFKLQNEDETPWHIDAYVNPFSPESPTGCKVRVMEKIHLNDQQIDNVKRMGMNYKPSYYGDGLDFQNAMSEFYNRLKNNIGELFGISGGFSSDNNDNDNNSWTTSIAADGANNIPGVAALKRFVYGAGIQYFMEDITFFKGTAYPMEIYGWDGTEEYFTFEPYPRISMEVGVSMDDVGTVVEYLTKVVHENPAPTLFQLRFVKSSTANLCPGRYGDITAHINFPCFDIPDTTNLYKEIQETLEVNRDTTPFTYHFGKIVPLNAEVSQKSYGAALDSFKELRQKFLDDDEMYIFSSNFTDAIGFTNKETEKTI